MAVTRRVSRDMFSRNRMPAKQLVDLRRLSFQKIRLHNTEVLCRRSIGLNALTAPDRKQWQRNEGVVFPTRNRTHRFD